MAGRRRDPARFDASRPAAQPYLRRNPRGTPQDAFTQAIATQRLTFPIRSSLRSAFLFGAFHALSPGHGKAMVAAYLVGSREQ